MFVSVVVVNSCDNGGLVNNGVSKLFSSSESRLLEVVLDSICLLSMILLDVTVSLLLDKQTVDVVDTNVSLLLDKEAVDAVDTLC